MVSSPSLDNNKHNCNNPCGYMCASGEVIVNDRKVQAFVRMRCKSWNCPICGPRKAYRLSRAMVDWAKTNDLTRFMTLTLDPKKLPLDTDSVTYISKLWCKFRVYLGRKLGKNIQYIAVKEFQKNGRAHLHVLINKYIHWKWIRSSWSRLGGGTHTHIRRTHDVEKEVRYVCKYLTKGMLSVPKKTRYTTSKGIKLNKQYIHTGQMELFEVKKKSTWSLMGGGIEDYYYSMAPNIITEEYETDGSLKFFSTSKKYQDWMSWKNRSFTLEFQAKNKKKKATRFPPK